MPTVSVTPLLVRKSRRNIKAPTYLGDEPSPVKAKAVVLPLPLLAKKPTPKKHNHTSTDETLEVEAKTSPVRFLGHALRDEVAEPTEVVSTLVVSASREKWDRFSKCALFEKWQSAKETLDDYRKIVVESGKTTSALEREVGRLAKTNTKLVGLNQDLHDSNLDLNLDKERNRSEKRLIQIY